MCYRLAKLAVTQDDLLRSKLAEVGSHIAQVEDLWLPLWPAYPPETRLICTSSFVGRSTVFFYLWTIELGPACRGETCQRATLTENSTSLVAKNSKRWLGEEGKMPSSQRHQMSIIKVPVGWGGVSLFYFHCHWPGKTLSSKDFLCLSTGGKKHVAIPSKSSSLLFAPTSLLDETLYGESVQ
jgi:hypothetical protein